uniref:BolA-like protein n=1 Tax=Arcella intermedia TaxID=1963864 RepID=A0A6B2LU73_9EUKA
MVSSEFEGKSLLEQHRMVNTTLQEELQSGVHALALKTMTPERWSAQSGSSNFTTPNCLGGSKK